MSKNQLTKDEIKTFVLKMKHKLNTEGVEYSSDPKSLANRYINYILDRIEEYRI